MRGFVAIKLSDPLVERVVAVQGALRRSGADVRWVTPESVHLTLAFLGEIGEEQATRFVGLMRSEAARWPPLDLEYAGTGVFPRSGLPRVVWIGCRGDVEKLAGLAAACRRAAERVGVPPDRHPFVAHVTIGRVKSGRGAKRLTEAVKIQDEVDIGRERAGEFALMESTLTPDGPIYAVREAFALGAG